MIRPPPTPQPDYSRAGGNRVGAPPPSQVAMNYTLTGENASGSATEVVLALGGLEFADDEPGVPVFAPMVAVGVGVGILIEAAIGFTWTLTLQKRLPGALGFSDVATFALDL